MKTEELEAALNCTIEHLEGEHDGKIVADREIFDCLYDAARHYHAILPLLEGLIEARGKATSGEWAVDGWNTDNLIIEAHGRKGRFLTLASFNNPGSHCPSADSHFASAAANLTNEIKKVLKND